MALTSDFIAGFCGESEAAHEATLSLIKEVRYDFAYCFPYSMRQVCPALPCPASCLDREGERAVQRTRAHRRLSDDVPEEVKRRRARELVDAFRDAALRLHSAKLGSTQLVLVAGPSRRFPLPFLPCLIRLAPACPLLLQVRRRDGGPGGRGYEGHLPCPRARPIPAARTVCSCSGECR